MLDNIFRVFMFVLPFLLCVAAYVWVGKKLLRVPHRIARIIAGVVVCGGLAYTLYRFVRSVSSVLTNDNFEYIIVIVTVAVLALASIIMALGEPEEPVKANHPVAPPADDQKN